MTALFTAYTRFAGHARSRLGTHCEHRQHCRLIGYAYVSAYCAAKHGLIGLTRSLALEVATKGVTVNAVCPGYTETEMLQQTIDGIVAKTGRTPAEARAELSSKNPQKRMIQPEEVANAVTWLCLPGSEAITGQSIAVAGGEVM